MTLTVSVITQEYAACVVDRRLTTSRAVVSEQARKLVQLDTGSFKGLFAYNGIGRTPKGETPNDWLSEAQVRGPATLEQFCACLKEIAEPRIRALAHLMNNNPRHTFVLVGFDAGTPVMGLVSNYESLEGSDLTQAKKELDVQLYTPNAANTRGGCAVTGATNIVRKRSRDALEKALSNHVSHEKMLACMTKVIRDTAYVDRLKGSVGSSVMSSVYDPVKGFVGGGGAVGGSKYIEAPDAFLGGNQFRDIWITTTAREGSRYNPELGRFDFGEQPCPNCGNPVPDGHRRCNSCDHAFG